MPLVLKQVRSGGESALGRISWTGVIAGTAVALLAGRSILVAMPDFYGMIAYEERPGDTVVFSSQIQTVAINVQMLVWAISWSLAYFLGGLVAGRTARSSGGLGGMLTAVLGAMVGAAWFAWGVLPLVPYQRPGGVYRRQGRTTSSYQGIG